VSVAVTVLKTVPSEISAAEEEFVVPKNAVSFLTLSGAELSKIIAYPVTAASKEPVRSAPAITSAKNNRNSALKLMPALS
jgi:hypothetical protein